MKSQRHLSLSARTSNFDLELVETTELKEE